MEQAQRLSEIRELDWLAPITREALRLACVEAGTLHSSQVYPEHLLLGLLALEGQSLGQLFRANSLGIAQVRKRVQERNEQMVGPLLVEEITFSDEARECLWRAIAALVSGPPQPGVSKRLSPELLALSLLAHARVQRVLASAATLVLLIHTRLIEQVGEAAFQRMERRFIFSRSRRQEERISLHYVTIGQQRRILKSVEPPQYRFRDLADLGPVHRDVQGLVALLASARKQPAHSRGLLLIEPTGKRIKRLARAMAGEAGAPLTIVFCPVLAEIWQESLADKQPTTILRELFLSLRLLSASLIYLEDLDTLATIDEDEQEGRKQLFWTAFLTEIDKLLAQPGVVLLVATRKLEVLPPELLTSTRLGQGLVVDAPAVIEASERQPARVATGKKGRQPPGPAPHLLCPACHQPIQEHWLHCVYCGVSIARACPKCGSPTPEIPGARFCFHCGHQFT
jgi:double zinc ribbon protein/ATPase family protein associated with various cellular activities (AAA)/ClpA/ClpB-like protein